MALSPGSNCEACSSDVDVEIVHVNHLQGDAETEVAQLIAMGFDREKAEMTFLCCDRDLHRAIASLCADSNPARQLSNVEQLMAMGFSRQQSEEALSVTAGHLESAVERLLGTDPQPEDPQMESLRNREEAPRALIQLAASSSRASGSAQYSRSVSSSSHRTRSGSLPLAASPSRESGSAQYSRSASSSSDQAQLAQSIPHDMLVASSGAEFFTPSNPPTKRRKIANAADVPADTFVLKGNASDAPADNPPKLCFHPLREEQRRSLTWMLNQEGRKGVQGGILAEKMGYGKTATTIGLLSLGRKSRMSNVTKEYVRCHATLVLSPSHLVQQWVSEMKKFLGESKVHILTPGRACRDGLAFKVLVIPTVAKMKTCSGSDLLAADVVIASYAVQASSLYQKRVTELIDNEYGTTSDRLYGRKLSTMYGKPMAKRLAALREVIQLWDEHGKISEHVLKSRFPVFEVFWWKRIVMDEFHESESWEYRVREMFKAIGATYRWGLSGTPPVSNLLSIRDVAAILWCEGELKVVADAQLFLDEYVRQNSSALVDAIQIVSHVEYIAHTREEGILYRQACHDQGIFDLEEGYTELSLSSRAILLKRCSHFDLGAEAGSAQEAVQRVGEQKRTRITDIQEQLRIEAMRCIVKTNSQSRVRKELLDAVKNDLHEDAKAFVSQMCNTDSFIIESCESSCAKAFEISLQRYDSNGELRVEPKVDLKQPIPASDYYEDGKLRHAVLHWVVRNPRAKHTPAKSMLRDADGRLSRMEMCLCDACGFDLEAILLAGLSALIRLLSAAHRSLQFFDQQLQSVGAEAGGEGRTCSICLEDDCPMASLCILPCAHVFHTSCIRVVLGVHKTCPECRQPVQGRNVSSLQLELEAPEANALDQAGLGTIPTPLQRAHGTKLNAVARTLLKICGDDADSKAIVFVQWSDLEDKVEQALCAHGISVLRCSERTKINSDVLTRFQEDPKAPAALVLSLERAASGTNLTAASHVLFVHPMNADTVATAVAWEKQAIGRVRRIGQKRDEIHVYRFVARDTVEEHITRFHQQHA